MNNDLISRKWLTDFEKSVVEIIHRLDGFERFVSEQKGGAE